MLLTGRASINEPKKTFSWQLACLDKLPAADLLPLRRLGWAGNCSIDSELLNRAENCGCACGAERSETARISVEFIHTL
jgi:hypothetical protein